MAFDQLQTMASMCDPNVAEWGSSYTGLLGILKGTIAAGRACTPKGNVNDKAVIAAALASCLDLPHTACMPVPPSVSEPLPTWTCDAKGAAGANCFTDANCMDGLYCDNPQVKLSSKNTCKVRKQPGEGCVNPNECASFFCKKSVCVAKDVQPAYCLQNN
jgi:hypothetical protein